MTLDVKLPTDPADEDLFEEEGGITYNMRELLDQIYEHKDLIITLPTEQVELLKEGLIIKKSRDNKKLKDSGILPMTEVLSFAVYKVKDAEGKELDGISDVRIKLGSKRSVQVLGIKVPANEF